jgi:hypothetical protein
MAGIFWAGWISSFTSSIDTVNPIFLTLTFPPGLNIFVSVSISSFSQGVDVSRPVTGMVASGVRRWEVFNPDGSIAHVDPGPDHAELNGVFIENCASVTVELATLLARAWAQVSVSQV